MSRRRLAGPAWPVGGAADPRGRERRGRAPSAAAGSPARASGALEVGDPRDRLAVGDERLLHRDDGDLDHVVGRAAWW